MQKRYSHFIMMLVVSIFFTSQAQAICPICTVAVGAGVGLAQWFGIDDIITGIWVGGLTVSLIGWTINWFNKKNIRFYGRKILIILFYYGIIVIPLYYKGLIGHPLNKLWGIDKLLLGIIIGSIAFFAATVWYFILKKNNNDHAYFPFQKIIMPVSCLILLSMIFYFIAK